MRRLRRNAVCRGRRRCFDVRLRKHGRKPEFRPNSGSVRWRLARDIVTAQHTTSVPEIPPPAMLLIGFVESGALIRQASSLGVGASRVALRRAGTSSMRRSTTLVC